MTAGNPLTDPIVIDEEDQYGNVETSDNSTRGDLVSRSGAGTLKGTTIATVTAGVASFDDLEDDTAGTLSLQFAAGLLPTAIASPSTVAPGPATQLIVTESPAGVVAGAGFGLTIQARDNFGNVADSFDGPVTVALASGSNGSLTGTVTQMASGGVVTFADLTDTTSGSLSLSVTGGGLKPATTSPVPISPGPPSKLLIQTQPSSTVTAGQPLAIEPVIERTDQFGNLVQGDDGAVVTADLGSGAGTLGGTLTAILSGGVATFTDLAENTAGTISLQFTGAGVSSLPSAAIVVSPAAASKLVIGTEPSSKATAGQAFGIQPVVYEEDQFGNLETSDNSTVITASLASGSGPMHGTLTATVTGGVGTFKDLEDNIAGTVALKFTRGGLNSVVANATDVAAAPATQLVVTSSAAKHSECWPGVQHGRFRRGPVREPGHEL